jgi:anthranilate/para-aminobenzoate synthase component I
VGNFSYDTVRYVETKKLPFSKAPEDDRNLPDIHLGLYNDVVVFDHVEKVWTIRESLYAFCLTQTVVCSMIFI